jgi:rRNA small subunit pseudouridine methyltransferase Nep1
MFNLIIADAELERIPQDITSHPVIFRYAKQKGKPATKLLLNSSIHHAAMANLPEGRRRGRPDITHLILLVALESILNKQDQLRVWIHTRNDDVITVNPQTRIMRNEERFAGLLEQLFDKGAVPDPQKPLLALKKQTLPELLKELHSDHVFACDQNGTQKWLVEYFHGLNAQHKQTITAVIGGFPSGPYHTDLSTIITDTISIYPEMLAAWTVTAELLVSYEHSILPSSP